MLPLNRLLVSVHRLDIPSVKDNKNQNKHRDFSQSKEYLQKECLFRCLFCIFHRLVQPCIHCFLKVLDIAVDQLLVGFIGRTIQHLCRILLLLLISILISFLQRISQCFTDPFLQLWVFCVLIGVLVCVFRVLIGVLICTFCVWICILTCSDFLAFKC